MRVQDAHCARSGLQHPVESNLLIVVRVVAVRIAIVVRIVVVVIVVAVRIIIICSHAAGNRKKGWW